MKLLVLSTLLALAVSTASAHLAKPLALLHKDVGVDHAPPVVVAEEKVVHLTHVKHVPYEVVKEVPIEKEVVKFVDRPVEKISHYNVETVVWQDKVVEKPYEVVKEVEKVVEDRVEKPVWRTEVVDRPYQVVKYVPQEKVVTKYVEFPVDVNVEVIREKEVFKDKEVEAPAETIEPVPFETVVDVPHEHVVHEPVAVPVHFVKPTPVVVEHPVEHPVEHAPLLKKLLFAKHKLF